MSENGEVTVPEADRWSTLDAVIASLDEQLFASAEHLFLDHDLLADPFSHLAAIREKFGYVVDRAEAAAADLDVPNVFLLDESHGIHLVLGYEEASDVYRHPAVSTGYAGSIELVFGRSMTMLDGKDHARIRGLVQAAFRRSVVERWSAEIMVPAARHLVGRIGTLAAPDLVRDLSAPLAFVVMSDMFGLADEDLPKFVRIASELLHIAYDFDGAMAARDELTAFLAEQVEARRSHPTDDLIGLLVDAEVDGERLTDEEILSNLRQLVPAGIETTFRSSSNMWTLLLTNPEQLVAVQEDASLVGPAIEESLRLEGPSLFNPRVANEPIEIGGVAIAPGGGMLVSQGAANRDPRRWEDPNRFDVRRPSKPHLAFITGPHTCVGLHLARAQMRAALEEILEHHPGITLAVPADSIERLGVILRSPVRCPVLVA